MISSTFRIYERNLKHYKTAFLKFDHEQYKETLNTYPISEISLKSIELYLKIYNS